jgi:hypothetical protein
MMGAKQTLTKVLKLKLYVFLFSHIQWGLANGRINL